MSAIVEGVAVLKHVRINHAMSSLTALVREEAAEVPPLLWTTGIPIG